MPDAYSIDTLLEQMVATMPPICTSRWARRRAPPARPPAPARSASPLSADDTRQLLYRILSTEQQKQLELNRQIDLSTRFRASPGFV